MTVRFNRCLFLFLYLFADRGSNLLVLSIFHPPFLFAWCFLQKQNNLQVHEIKKTIRSRDIGRKIKSSIYKLLLSLAPPTDTLWSSFYLEELWIKWAAPIIFMRSKMGLKWICMLRVLYMRKCGSLTVQQKPSKKRGNDHKKMDWMNLSFILPFLLPISSPNWTNDGWILSCFLTPIPLSSIIHFF